MDSKDTMNAYADKVKDISATGNKNYKLRSIHIDVENIYEDIKNNKSSVIYKNIFWLLFGVSFVVFAVHTVQNGFGWGLVFLILLIAYFFYYTYIIKSSIRANIKTKNPSKIEPEKAEFLKERIKYISGGIRVTAKRAELVRNFYIIFFPLMTFTLIDILKGPFTAKAYFVIFIVSVLIGGVFWYYYFKNDLNDIESDIDLLQELNEKIAKI